MAAIVLTRGRFQIYKLVNYSVQSKHKWYSDHHHGGRTGHFGIQMISESLREQIFKQSCQVREEKVRLAEEHLHQYELLKDKEDARVLPEVDLELPHLFGNNIDEHFRIIATEMAKPYTKLAEQLVNSRPPEVPKYWVCTPGWVRYDGSTAERVHCLDEEAVVLDVEVCVEEGHQPVLATALSPNYWYSWTSERLVSAGRNELHLVDQSSKPFGALGELISLEPDGEPVRENTRKRLIVGHNVSYDRARIKEEYFIEVSIFLN